MKNILTEVVHSESKSAWNVISKTLGQKFKIARCPYIKDKNGIVETIEKNLALEHALFISDCFNKAYYAERG